MQSICLNLCYGLDLRAPLAQQQRVAVDRDRISQTLLETSSFTDFSKMVSALHTGPRTRGVERNVHDLTDGTRGDVYRAVLLAMRQDPARLTFPYDEIQARVKSVCNGAGPVGSSVTSALDQMEIIGDELQATGSPVTWDGDTADIADPYFLFFLRCSNKIETLAKG